MRLANVFQSHMVLQQEAKAAIWGWAKAGEEISIDCSWGQSGLAQAGEDGRWLTQIATPSAGGPYDITISGSESITLSDVLIGEVWLCSGQSNMEWVLANANDADLEIVCAADPMIRQLKVERTPADAPADDCTGSWSVCSPETAGQFTALGYFFAKVLRQALDVPVGLLNSSWGGSRIEAWLPREMCDLSLCAPDAAAQHSPAKLYNGMIHPLKPYGMRGVLWYQGESNAHSFENTTLYKKHLHCLAESWRSAWRDGTPDGRLPFYHIQLPGYKAETEAADPANAFWAAIRESFAQAATEITDCEIAVTLDAGEGNDIHPRNKQFVGRRLARLALHHTYGMKELAPTGPTYKSHQIEGNRVIIEFDNVGRGLAAFSQKLGGFVVAGEDRKFVWADAKIEENKVVLQAQGIDTPVAIRYAWADNPKQANLTNMERLPAAPFRTDDWPLARG